MQIYHRVHVQLRKGDRRRLWAILAKGRESARVLRCASILRQLVEGQKAARVAASAGAAENGVVPPKSQ